MVLIVPVMSQTPIQDFIYGMKSFHAHDFAVLFWAVAFEQRSWPISPAADTGRLFHIEGMTQEEIAASFKRLIDLGEIVPIESDQWRGYEVVRFDYLADRLADYGKRRYFRQQAAKRRKGREEATPA